MFFAKIPRHIRQNAITEGDLECILTRNCEGTEQLHIILLLLLSPGTFPGNRSTGCISCNHKPEDFPCLFGNLLLCPVQDSSLRKFRNECIAPAQCTVSSGKYSALLQAAPTYPNAPHADLHQSTDFHTGQQHLPY